MGYIYPEPSEWETQFNPTLIAFDPGGTTGWSLMMLHPDALSDPEVPILKNILHWDQGEIAESDELFQVDVIVQLLDAWEGATVLFEDFNLDTVFAELSPVRITARVEWVLQRLFDPPKPMFKQMPAVRLSATDARLKRWGLYRADGQGHARDATRHAIEFLKRAKSKKALRATAWPEFYSSAQTG